MRLHATVSGEGAPLCLLHGLFGRSQNLASLARRLSRHFRVISPDLRNHGASAHAPGMAYATLADDVLETLAQRGALPACVLGHSMGGKVAMMLALARPALVCRLVVADIAPVAYAHHNAGVARALLGLALTPGLSRGAADQALAGAVPDPAVRGFLLQNLAWAERPAWRIGLHEIAAGIADIEGWPALPGGARYDGPALFVSGALSDFVQPAHWPVVRALFPAAEAVRLDGAGHWLHADRPEAFGAAVERFLTGDTDEPLCSSVSCAGLAGGGARKRDP